MKKLIVVAALLFVPLLASAQQPDALLTRDGTLYTVQFERAEDHPDVVTESAAWLKVTARRGDDIRSEIIPSTLERGSNYNPTIAFDEQSGMLFVFWIHNQGMLSNQLMFTSRTADGTWAAARVFGDGYYDQRKNLRVAVTRKFRLENDELRSGLSVHLVWWELNTTTGKGSAKYAMASIHGGDIVDFIPVDLAEFVQPAAADEPVAPEGVAPDHTASGKDFLKQPLLFTTPAQDSVVVVYGDLATETLTQVRITPRKVIADGRLRVPGGRREGSFKSPRVDSDSRLEGLYVDSNRIALYMAGEGKLQYVLLDGKTASEPYAISLDEHLSAASAVDALRRLVNEHEH